MVVRQWTLSFCLMEVYVFLFNMYDKVVNGYLIGCSEHLVYFYSCLWFCRTTFLLVPPVELGLFHPTPHTDFEYETRRWGKFQNHRELRK